MAFDVESAVNRAQAYFERLKPQFGNEIEDLRLEEVERSEDDLSWLITLGYSCPTKVSANPLLSDSPRIEYERIYKVFAVNASSGDVESVKIRKL